MKNNILYLYRKPQEQIKNAYDVIIIGAGTSGFAVAKALSDRCFKKIIIIEQYEELKNIGGAFLLFPNGAKVLKDELGFSDVAKQHQADINYASTYATDGTKLNHGALDEFYKKVDERFNVYSRTDLQQSLLEVIKERGGIEIVFGYKCVKVEETHTGARVYLKHGTQEITLTSNYVCGADGVHSIVRGYINPENREVPIDLCVFGGILEKDRVELFRRDCNDNAIEVRCDEMVSHFGDNLSLWLAPISGGRLSFYIHARISKNEFRLRDDKWALLKELVSIWNESPIAQIFIKHIFSQGKTEHSFAVLIHEVNPLGPWVSKQGRVAIIGDAAHAFGSKLGVATTAALFDAVIFAVCLQHNDLHLYQIIRQPIAETFYKLEKEEQNETLTVNEDKIKERDNAIVDSKGKPLFLGLADILDKVSLDRQLDKLDGLLDQKKIYAKL